MNMHELVDVVITDPQGKNQRLKGKRKTHSCGTKDVQDGKFNCFIKPELELFQMNNRLTRKSLLIQEKIT